jgi:hypothetical protein
MDRVSQFADHRVGHQMPGGRRVRLSRGLKDTGCRLVARGEEVARRESIILGVWTEKHEVISV